VISTYAFIIQSNRIIESSNDKDARSNLILPMRSGFLFLAYRINLDW